MVQNVCERCRSPVLKTRQWERLAKNAYTLLAHTESMVRDSATVAFACLAPTAVCLARFTVAFLGRRGDCCAAASILRQARLPD